MNNALDALDKAGNYSWVILVGFIGGLLNVGNNRSKSIRRKISDLATGVVSSAFFGWISFEIVLHFYQSERLALAACGFFAWKGAAWISEVVDKAVDSRIKKGDLE